MESISALIRKFAIDGFVTDIEKDTLKNKNFRKVLYTGKNSQLVLMTLPPGEDIGEEVHDNTDQFFRVDSGTGKVVIDGVEHAIKDGFAIVIPQGAKHNVIQVKSPSRYIRFTPPRTTRIKLFIKPKMKLRQIKNTLMVKPLSR